MIVPVALKSRTFSMPRCRPSVTISRWSDSRRFSSMSLYVLLRMVSLSWSAPRVSCASSALRWAPTSTTDSRRFSSMSQYVLLRMVSLSWSAPRVSCASSALRWAPTSTTDIAPITSAVTSDTPRMASTPMRDFMGSVASGLARPPLGFAPAAPGANGLGENRQVADRQRERREAERHQRERHRELHPARHVVGAARALEPGDAHVEPVHHEPEHRRGGSHHEPGGGVPDARPRQEPDRYDHAEGKLDQEHPALVGGLENR